MSEYQQKKEQEIAKSVNYVNQHQGKAVALVLAQIHDFPLFPNEGEHADKNTILIDGEKTKSDLAFFDKETKTRFNAKIQDWEKPDPETGEVLKGKKIRLNVYDEKSKTGVNGIMFTNFDGKEKAPVYTGSVSITDYVEGEENAPKLRLAAWKKETSTGRSYLSLVVKTFESSEHQVSDDETPF